MENSGKIKKEEVKKVFELIRKKARKLRGAFAFELKLNNFQLLLSLILSSRTRDEITVKVAERLKKKVKNCDDLLKLSLKEIEELIYPVGFYKKKAKYLKEIAREIKEKYNGKVPKSYKELVKLKGVGRKVANLYLQIVTKANVIAVDTHVTKITSRIFAKKFKSPIEVENFWKENLPEEYWKEVNNTLVKFGQNICKKKPLCNNCPVKGYCKYFKKLKERN